MKDLSTEPLKMSRERLSSQTYESTVSIQSRATGLLRPQQKASYIKEPPTGLEKRSRCGDPDTLNVAIEIKVANSEQMQPYPTALDQGPKLLRRKRQRSLYFQALEEYLSHRASTHVLLKCLYGSPRYSGFLLKTALAEKRKRRAIRNLGRLVPGFSQKPYSWPRRSRIVPKP